MSTTPTITHNTIINHIHGLYRATYPLAEGQPVAGAFALHTMALRSYRAGFHTMRQERAAGVRAAAPCPILMGFRWTR